MTEPEAVTVDMRIPGNWSHPKELVQRLPRGYRLSPDGLVLPDGTNLDFTPVPADGQFAQVFRSACRQPPTPAELDVIDGYTVNLLLSGPGGSLDAARTLMRAAAALVQAGAGGVFIDNCALAHGGELWLEMTQDGSADAVSFAFVAVIRGREEVTTMGMHVLGLRDIVMKRTDVEDKGYDIVEVIRYLCRGDKPIEDGHIIADLDGPRFQAFAHAAEATSAPRAMQNPFGRLKLVSMREIGDSN